MARKKSPGFNGFWLDENGEKTQERVDFREWEEIIRLYWLGVELRLQTDTQQPTQAVS